MNRYDELKNLIQQWTKYVKLHRKIAEGKHMQEAWYSRMHKIEYKVIMWERERDLICELNQ